MFLGSDIHNSQPYYVSCAYLGRVILDRRCLLYACLEFGTIRHYIPCHGYAYYAFLKQPNKKHDGMQNLVKQLLQLPFQHLMLILKSNVNSKMDNAVKEPKTILSIKYGRKF